MADAAISPIVRLSLAPPTLPFRITSGPWKYHTRYPIPNGTAGIIFPAMHATPNPEMIEWLRAHQAQLLDAWVESLTQESEV
ncbi:MAG: hypothetical protein D6781_11990, partial [Verrucomicrobia bacterium]